MADQRTLATLSEILSQRLQRIYGSDDCLAKLMLKIEARTAAYQRTRKGRWDESDIILITYGDSLLQEGKRPLQVLNQFLRQHLADTFSAVHILPFFPYSSDDGFSVIDYRAVNYKLGTWDDVAQIAQSFDLMADLVCNHTSRQSLWFIDFINGEGEGKEFFVESDPDADYSSVIRPRTSPLIVDVYTRQGVKHVWATFSDDQIDLNFANPDVLIEMIDILLEYIVKGSRYIRLDAVAFLWKTLGSKCVHLPETHEVVKLMRDIFRWLDPGLVLITETNVPHEENISYFGSGDEAQMVYNFALPPLILHGLNRGNASYLTRWARSLPAFPAGCCFLNFTASHDGIGVRAVEGIIPKHEITDLIESVHQFGGFVSMKANGDGTKSPYELNISLFEALQGTRNGPDTFQISRFLCAQTIMLSLQGIPALYIHSLTATPNDLEQVELTGRTRSINRHKWQSDELNGLLCDPASDQSRIFSALTEIIKIRRSHHAFSPDASQEALVLSDTLFAIIRCDPHSGEQILCIHNLTAYPHEVHGIEKIPQQFTAAGCDELLTGKTVALHEFELAPYQCAWLVPCVE
ncbi:alpha-amylase [Corallincola luteus]|uniref:Alpha-amylase n=1 Tax=Corallincola luteus TaxID=1775177 RepID=A0ABY2ARG5_9GAMM|nr:sugar phosphorylase [Corallincola luteus]TCI04462.1 alpha-amylase [Corallincola luteus]